MSNKRKIKKCLLRGCDKKRHSRGLCVSCYSAAYRAVRDGRTTWGCLVRDRLALSSWGRKPPTAMSKALSRRKL